MKKILYLLALVPILVIGQTQSENYTKVTAYKVATQDPRWRGYVPQRIARNCIPDGADMSHNGHNQMARICPTTDSAELHSVPTKRIKYKKLQQ